MQEKRFYTQSKIHHHLFYDSLEKTMSSQTIGEYKRLVNDILLAINTKELFYFNEKGLRSLQRLTDTIHLRFSSFKEKEESLEKSRVELLEQRKILVRKIIECKRKLEYPKNIERIIEEERRIRAFPDIPLTIETLEQFYRQDFDSLRMINFEKIPENTEDFSLLAFLSMINKIYDECPAFIRGCENYTQYLLEQKRPTFFPDEEVEVYYENTINRIEEKKFNYSVLDFHKIKEKKKKATSFVSPEEK